MKRAPYCTNFDSPPTIPQTYRANNGDILVQRDTLILAVAKGQVHVLCRAC